MKQVIAVSLCVFLYAVLCIFSLTACENDGKKGAGTKSATGKPQLVTVRKWLSSSQITLSEIDSTKTFTKNTVVLSDKLIAKSGAVTIIARKRGVLLDSNRVVSSIRIRGEGYDKTWLALFDGSKKRLISAVFLGTRTDVFFIKPDASDSAVIEVSATVRTGDNTPASKIQNFKAKVEGNKIRLL